MNLKNVLCKINAFGNRLHGGRSFRLRGGITPIWAPRCRLKEGVHSISLEPSGFRKGGARTGHNVAVVVEYVDLEPVADGWFTD